MGRVFRPTRPLLDEHGQPVIGPDDQVVRVPRTKNFTIRTYDHLGKAHDISTGSPLISVAKKKLHDLESKKNKDEPIGAQVNRVTFDQAALDIENDYIANSRRSLK